MWSEKVLECFETGFAFLVVILKYLDWIFVIDMFVGFWSIFKRFWSVFTW